MSKNNPDGDKPVTRRECALIQVNMQEKISALRKEIIIGITVSTTWLTIFVALINAGVI